jgi:hypothetical protein
VLARRGARGGDAAAPGLAKGHSRSTQDQVSSYGPLTTAILSLPASSPILVRGPSSATGQSTQAVTPTRGSGVADSGSDSGSGNGACSTPNRDGGAWLGSSACSSKAQPHVDLSGGRLRARPCSAGPARSPLTTARGSPPTPGVTSGGCTSEGHYGTQDVHVCLSFNPAKSQHPCRQAPPRICVLTAPPPSPMVMCRQCACGGRTAAR